MKSTAIANANIALVKYWGKRNEKLILPTNPSVSMTTDKLNTTTTVEFNKKYSFDTVFLNGKKVSGSKEQKVSKHLDLIRKLSKTKQKAKVSSKNNFPTAAGLASSASGFAALTLAATTAVGLSLDERKLSIIARQGSGSASRSILGGFVKWNKGHKSDGSDSFGVQVVKPSYWKDFCMIATVVSLKEKKIKSRTGMKQTLLTSPMYKAWLETVEKDIKLVINGIFNKDFSTVGKISEMNALKMHSTMITTTPSIIYWQPATMEVIGLVQELREKKTECYFTMDAGPQVKVMCLKKNAKKIMKKLAALKEVKKTILCTPGEGAKISEKHLF